MADTMEDELTDGGSYAVKVGARLRAIRKQKRLSLQDVEARSGQEFKASVLGAYERGERAISVPRLQRLARFYSVPVDQLLPTDTGGGPTIIDLDAEDAASEPMEMGGITIDLVRLDDMDDEGSTLIHRYLSMIQVQRGDFNGRVLTIRRDDLRAIACLLDTTPDQARRQLDERGLRLRL